MGSKCAEFGVIALTLSHTGHWKFNMAPHDEELSDDLKKIIVAPHRRWPRPRPYSSLTGQIVFMVDQRS